MYPLYEGERIKFHCLNCGQCCRNLLKENEGMTLGLTLTKDEAKLFPQNVISPAHGRGKNSLSVNPITMYQLNVGECPFLEKTKKCRIYANRPLTCRRFPLVYSSGPMSNVALGSVCKFIKQVETNIGYALNFLFTPDTFVSDDCWKAHLQFARIMEYSGIDAQLEQMKIYNFNLKTKEWEKGPIVE